MRTNPVILFLSHDASRTGAPLVLLHLMRWLKSSSRYRLKLLVGRDGDLVKEFSEVAETTVWGDWTWGTPRPLYQRLLRKTGLAYQADYRTTPLERLYPAGSIDCIYANTVVTGSILEELNYLGAPAVAHVHEMSFSIDMYGPRNRGGLLANATRFIAVSTGVEKALMERGVARDRIDFIQEPFIGRTTSAQDKQTIAAAFRQLHGIPEQSFIVGGCGAGKWRKGQDLFLQVAMLLRRIDPAVPTCFVWLGGESTGRDCDEFRYDVERSGAAAYVRVLPRVADPSPFYAACDLFCMTSREDPFPLVNLEAAMQGIPIVCFDKSGGSVELVRDDGGYCVPYLDTLVMAERIQQLARNESLRRTMGSILRQRVSTNLMPENIMPKIKRVIDLCLDEANEKTL